MCSMRSNTFSLRVAGRFCLWALVIIGLVVSQAVQSTVAVSFSEVGKYMVRPWCVMECCNTDTWIHLTNITALRQAFKEQLFGQHLVAQYVPGALAGHLLDKDPPKPLVLSFHGPTGTGKNHVTRLIAESIFAKGLASDYVTLFLADRDFPHARLLDTYKDTLRETIQRKLRRCPYHLFIFDEVEDMPAGLIGSIRSFLDYNIYYQGVDLTKAIYIFLSNTGSREIIVKMKEHFTAGHKRETVSLKQMEEIIEQIAFNSEGGFAQSRLIDHNVVSHYVPFLPLQVQHVRDCVLAALQKQPLHRAGEELVERVVQSLQFVPKGTGLFALKGCKNVAEKVVLVRHQLRKEL